MSPALSSASGAGPRRRAGQTLLFLLMLLTLLAFVVLFVFDVHKTIFVKTRAQNAGDAAALAGARWQAVALNLVGELNVLQAVAITDALARGQEDFPDPEAEALADLAARLNFAGPLVGLAAAQQAALQNRAYADEEAADRLRRHAARVARDYPAWFPPPFGRPGDEPSPWEDYAGMIRAVADSGIAAEPALPGYGYIREIPGNEHLLLNPSFYYAVLSRNWCWFHFRPDAMNTLRAYRQWTDWPPLPLERVEPVNSEFLDLGLVRVPGFDRIPGLEAHEVPELLRRISGHANRYVDPRTAEVRADWFCFSASRWRPWTDVLPAGFPFESPIRAGFDVFGADSVVAVSETVSRLTPGAARPDVAWTAAAKPFGLLEGGGRATRFGLVLPAFTDVRLIPVGASSNPSGGGVGWATHVYEHLPQYLARGPEGLSSGCAYCMALSDLPGTTGWWEDPAFRAEGLAWLATNSHTCVESGPGPGTRGGTRIGH